MRPYIIFTINKDKYALPFNDILNINERVKVIEAEYNSDYYKGIIIFNSQVIPVADFSMFYINNSSGMCLIYKTISVNKEIKVAIWADNIYAVEQIVEDKIFSPAYIQNELIEALFILDNTLVSVLDMKNFLKTSNYDDFVINHQNIVL